MADYLKNKKNISGMAEDIIKKIAYRYINDNAPREFYAMPSVKNVFKQHTDGMFDIDFDRLYPNAPIESFAYACTYLYSDEDTEVTVKAELTSGGSVWINGECIAKTTVEDENRKRKINLPVKVRRGKNPVFIKAQKTGLGFGVRFGEACIAWKPNYMYMPFKEYEGYLGIAYSSPFERDIYKEPCDFPDIDSKIPDSFVKAKTENKFAFEKAGYIYAASSLETDREAEAELSFSASCNTAVYVNAQKAGEGRGKFTVNVKLKKGRNSVVAELVHEAGSSAEFECSAAIEGAPARFLHDKYMLTSIDWLFFGVLSKRNYSVINYKDISDTESFENEYWRAGISDCYIRKLRDDDIYGKWTYPIGVVLYGLLAASEVLSDNSLKDYVINHLKMITKNQSYADFDMAHNGVPSVNRQISCLGMLDYCGSCGNALLEAMNFTGDNEQFKEIAWRVASYIENVQERLPNGMFYREREDSIIDYMTVWADDLYMSVPFLCRYYKLTGDKKYIDDAANQLLCFKEKLYMPEKGCMSHVYNLIYDKKTGVPWGRGNGWVMVALTELLEVLPPGHKSYKDILSFYTDFCAGILKLQGKNGMWHQVLNHSDSYEETSCTAMFTYGFARGFSKGRLGFEFKKAALMGWQGIISEAVDSDGNVYGVCCGSAYSFRPDYYKYELPWKINDTHGTGIVLLAGTEISKINEGRN